MSTATQSTIHHAISVKKAPAEESTYGSLNSGIFELDEGPIPIAVLSESSKGDLVSKISEISSASIQSFISLESASNLAKKTSQTTKPIQIPSKTTKKKKEEFTPGSPNSASRKIILPILKTNKQQTDLSLQESSVAADLAEELEIFKMSP